MSEKKTLKEYTNGEITITWEPNKCIHAKKCWKELGAVFRPLKRPWVDPQGATTEAIAKQIDQCPSGALGYYYNNEKNNEMEETQDPTVQLKVNKNGSLKVTGKVEILLPDGSTEVKEGRFSLCRCGLSEKKPFCDGSHKETNYDANWDIEQAPKE